MENKQKRIEEMEKDIAVRMAMAKGVAGSMNNGVEGWLGKYLIEQGYRKIPENAVVLTREDMKKYAEDCIAGKETGLDIINALIARGERYKEKAKQTRKETAEKIDDYLVKRINENFEKLKKEQELPVIREAILRGMLYVRNAEREIAKEFTEGRNDT
jgi:hypothetical protein